MKAKHLLPILAAVLALSCTRTLRDGEYTLTVLSTNDLHGTFFDSTYTGGGIKKSLFAINHYVDSVRTADGFDNVLLVDAGDCLQGDNCVYYFNYVDTVSTHLFSRLMEYMKYDAIAVGNHDIETGHPVYDRVDAELHAVGADFLAGNAIRNDNGKTYFPLYKTVYKSGLKIAVLGYTNANIKAWLTEDIWSGMHFVSIAEIIQRDVDMVRAKEHPDVLVATMHSACGNGDGTILEAEALDAFNSVSGVDFLVCGHDHRPYVETRDTCALLNSGSHSRFVGWGKMHMKVEGGKVVSKTFETALIPVKAQMADPVMREHFQADFEAVKAFTLREVGESKVAMNTRDAYAGMCHYTNLIHTVCLERSGADISFTAPLTFDGHIKKGPVIYNDLFTLYPYENQLFLITMTGEEVVKYLEASYDLWIVTASSPKDHVLNIVHHDDPRTLRTGWSFAERSYNFSSAAGINYTVDVTKPYGQRINVSTMADGTPFDLSRTYKVSVTSYRASGGGGLLQAAGVDTEHIADRTVERYPEIRNILYDYLMEHGTIDPEVVGNPAVIGSWRFVPDRIAAPAVKQDMLLLFGEKLSLKK